MATKKSQSRIGNTIVREEGRHWSVVISPPEETRVVACYDQADPSFLVFLRQKSCFAYDIASSWETQTDVNRPLFEEFVRSISKLQIFTWCHSGAIFELEFSRAIKPARKAWIFLVTSHLLPPSPIFVNIFSIRPHFLSLFFPSFGLDIQPSLLSPSPPLFFSSYSTQDVVRSTRWLFRAAMHYSAVSPIPFNICYVWRKCRSRCWGLSLADTASQSIYLVGSQPETLLKVRTSLWIHLAYSRAKNGSGSTKLGVKRRFRLRMSACPSFLYFSPPSSYSSNGHFVNDKPFVRPSGISPSSLLHPPSLPFPYHHSIRHSPYPPFDLCDSSCSNAACVSTMSRYIEGPSDCNSTKISRLPIAILRGIRPNHNFLVVPWDGGIPP